MSTLVEVDAWAGKTLFVPIIIRVCQLTGQSQYAISRLLWLMAGLYLLYFAEGAANTIIFGLLCFFLMLSAGLRADMPTHGFVWVRAMWWAFFLYDALLMAIGEADRHVAADIIILFAEYATTITTVPPRSTGRRKSSSSALSSGH